MKEQEVKIGSKAKDKITGFSGVITGYCIYISGCHQALLIPPVKEDGAFQDGHWFDIQRLEQLDDSVIELENEATPGADIPAPIR